MTNKPIEVMQTAINAGCYKCGIGTGNMMLRGFMGGLYIAIGAALATVCSTGVGGILGPGVARLIAGAVFPVGLIAIVLTGMELFTGDAMLGPMAAFRKRTTWMKVMKLWLFVYIGNFIGSLFWAYVMYASTLTTNIGATTPVFAQAAAGIADAKTLPYKEIGGFGGWWAAFVSGIACNLIVNVAILISFSSKNMVGKFFGIWFPIFAFVAIGFEHSIANMYFIPAGLFTGLTQSTWGDFFWWNLIPVTIGNVVGAFVFIAVIYYLAFKKELPEEAK